VHETQEGVADATPSPRGIVQPLPKGMLGGFVSITQCTTSASVTFSRVGATI